MVNILHFHVRISFDFHTQECEGKQIYEYLQIQHKGWWINLGAQFINEYNMHKVPS